MARLLEIISKKESFKTNEVELKLLQTNFTKLGKLLGSDTGKDWKTLTSGDVLSVEALQSLNDSQQELIPIYEQVKVAFNQWVSLYPNLELSKITQNMVIGRWSDSYVAGVTQASYHQVLSDIANSEREIRETFNYNYNNKLKQNQNILKEWSKTRRYGSCVYSCRSPEFDKGDYEGDWKISSSNLNGINVKIYRKDKYKDKRRIEFYNVQNLRIGYTATATLRGAIRDGYGWAYVYVTWSITRVPLFKGDTEGHIRFNATSGGGRHQPYVSKYNNVSSPHFDTENVTFQWLKSRIII